MVSRVETFGVLIGAAVCTLFLVPAHGSAQDSLSISIADVQFLSPFEDLTPCAEEGDAEAQGSLGLRYYAGGGAAPLDYAEALRWRGANLAQRNSSPRLSSQLFRRGFLSGGGIAAIDGGRDEHGRFSQGFALVCPATIETPSSRLPLISAQ